MELLTSEDKAKLEKRLGELISNRPHISQRIAEARELGDLKENAEYHAAREDQGMQEAEIRRLEGRLASVQVADAIDTPDDMVYLGSIVCLKDMDTGIEDDYKLVGEASGNFDSDEIEVTATSPMGVSLMKSRVGEEVRVDLPRGPKRFKVLSVK